MPYGKPSTRKERWDRFVWNLEHLHDDELNPYVLDGEGDLKPKHRTAWEDITHSLKNLFVRQKEPKE